MSSHCAAIVGRPRPPIPEGDRLLARRGLLHRLRDEEVHLAGVARNLNDGRVEMIVEGPVNAVDAFVAWARIGPPRAHVTGIEIEGQPPTGQRGFSVR